MEKATSSSLVGSTNYLKTMKFFSNYFYYLFLAANAFAEGEKITILPEDQACERDKDCIANVLSFGVISEPGNIKRIWISYGTDARM